LPYPEHAVRNKQSSFKDVGCLDATRVKLLNRPASDDYVHANYVSTPTCTRRFICTQGARKCYQYYPTKGTLKFDDITITHTGSTMVKFMCTTKAKVKVTSLTVEKGGKKLKTKHLQWEDWPDRGVPPADTAIIQILDIIKTTQAPIVVHCSAGVGRTGSLVMIQHILESMSLNQQIEDSNKLLLKLRTQRANTIQTDQQYLFVHQVLLNYFQENQLLDQRWVPYLDHFKKEYNKFVY
ncbi:Protein-tyrosine phosphatase, partial [Oesophagostomum dentatum]